jgi:hypothetical protein
MPAAFLPLVAMDEAAKLLLIVVGLRNTRQ